MATPITQDLLDTAVELTRQAGEFTLQHFRTDLAIDRKGDGSPVTVADRGAERLLREELGQRFPDDGIFGEEEDEKPGTSGRRWIIDPIDGTKAFTHGVPLYTNLLALEDDDGVAIGVINVPALGQTVWAGRGLGCFDNGEPASVNNHESFDGAYLSTSGYSPWSDETMLAVKHAGIAMRTWGDGYGYVLVATGRIEAMFDPVAELYDLAPVPIIMSESGGRFSSLDGREGPDHGHGLATNGRIHDDLLTLLQQATGVGARA
jgi:histidinol-phosphatase